MSGTSSFWIKQGLAIVVVIIIGVVLININDWFSGSDQPARERKDPATGFSEFYSEYRSSGGNVPSLNSDFVVELEPSSMPLDDRLMEMDAQSKPAEDTWEGEFRYRSFSAGMTLREALSSFAREEGMQLLWELPQDFVIKDHFQMEGSILETVDKVARTINANFPQQVRGFFCPNQRTLVVTTQNTTYLRQQCVSIEGQGDF